MKEKIFFPAISFAVLLVVSCTKQDFLEQTQTTDLTEQSVFTDSTRSMNFLTDIYTETAFSMYPSRFGNGGLDAATDELEVPGAANITSSIQFATGSVNPAIISNDAWATPYSNIRAVNNFLKHIPQMPFGAQQKVRVKAEARFLRAWYYSILLQHYGGVPLIGDTLFTATDKIPTVRNTYEQCVNYITAECDAAAADLPVKQTGLEFGRVGRGACLALKSRVLLYAASPLFNGSDFVTSGDLKAIVGFPTADQERWKKAADAARQVIATNEYALVEDNTTKPGYGFVKVFITRVNTEYIFQAMRGQNWELEFIWQPRSRGGGGRGGGYPYQEMVDAFPMANGKPISDSTSGYNPVNPYANRDPRMDNSIIRDQTPIITRGASSPVPVNIYLGPGATQDAVRNGTPTGYYVNKMLDPAVAGNDLTQTPRCLPLIRFAEVLLNFAEATNEYAGPTKEVYDAMEAIRKRAGLNPFLLPTGLSKSQMREAIQNERRIELAYEGFRFFDVRRWMIAEQTQSLMMHGMEVSRPSPGIATYKIFDVRKHNFTKANYLWPIPQSEIGKSPELLQNPYY